MQTTSRRNVLILGFALLVVTLGYGIISPILPFYMDTMGAGGKELGLLVASYGVMRLVFGPLWGSLSDRVGRKPVLLIGILGYAITMFWFGLANCLWMLFAARILSGVLSSATAPTSMAYISDSTSQKERGGGMGLLGMAGGVGAILGPALGGLLGGQSLSSPFFLAGGLSLLALLLALICLPESLPQAERQADGEGVKPFDRHLWADALRGPLGVLFGITFITNTSLMIFMGVFGLYALKRFAYGPEQVGVAIMVLGGVMALAQGVLAGPLTRRLGEALLVSLGGLAAACGYGFLLLADNYAFLLLATGVLGLASALQAPVLTSLTSQRSPLTQGIVMGMSNSFVSLGRIFGPLLGGWIFDYDMRLPFVLGGVLMAASCGVAYWGVVRGKEGEPRNTEIF